MHWVEKVSLSFGLFDEIWNLERNPDALFGVDVYVYQSIHAELLWWINNDNTIKQKKKETFLLILNYN